MAQLITNVLKDKNISVVGDAKTFEDEISSQYTDAVNTCASAGIIEGYDDGTFSGTKPMLGDSGATVISRLIKVVDGESIDPTPTPCADTG